jgi:hypothetical protein
MATLIDNEINRIKQNIEESYLALKEKGATMPTERTSGHLLDTIKSLSVGGGSPEVRYSEGLNYWFFEYGGGYYVSVGECTDEHIVIPPTYNGVNVIGIDEFGFDPEEQSDNPNCINIKSVVLPNTIESIQDCGFQGLFYLEAVYFPRDCNLGADIFYDCNDVKFYVSRDVTQDFWFELENDYCYGTNNKIILCNSIPNFNPSHIICGNKFIDDSIKAIVFTDDDKTYTQEYFIPGYRLNNVSLTYEFVLYKGFTDYGYNAYDTAEYLIYLGQETYNGEVCDKWEQYGPNGTDGLYGPDLDAHKYIYTDILVSGNKFIKYPKPYGYTYQGEA